MRTAIALAMALLCLQATARESGPELFKWFMRIGGEYPCAEVGMAHVVALNQWTCATEDGPCAVSLDDEWIPIAPLAMVDEPNRIGPAVVWLDEDGDIVCFMPGVRT